VNRRKNKNRIEKELRKEMGLMGKLKNREREREREGGKKIQFMTTNV
jgi:hypothetical protein